jgi:hypothetical protein
MTATTAIYVNFDLKEDTPDAVRTGFAFNFGRRYFFHWSGIAAMMSTSRGCVESLNFLADLDFKAFKLTV